MPERKQFIIHIRFKIGNGQIQLLLTIMATQIIFGLFYSRI